ncbi:MAG: hypothetical protein GY715_21845 [Planctomycetes bacterium]|nr:hypothetical protein [Planctomycetota bacterium]
MPRGLSLVGLLVSLVCVVVLFAIGMNAMNKAVTGEGSAVEGTVHSFEDKLSLYALHQSLVVNAQSNKERFITPSGLTDGGIEEDTTANLFSAMVMGQYIKPEQLISGNEYSGYVEVDHDYDYTRHDPSAGVYWDPRFEADLFELSNVSFAHVPLLGERRDRHWRSSLGARFPILGNRGPADGVENPESMTYGRNGQWGGHLVYGDGHIEFVTSFIASGTTIERDGQVYADNVFALEDGPEGADTILAFTLGLTRRTVELQWD